MKLLLSSDLGKREEEEDELTYGSGLHVRDGQAQSFQRGTVITVMIQRERMSAGSTISTCIRALVQGET